MRKLFFLLLAFCSSATFAQAPQVQNASIAKDAQVDVTVTDFKDNALPHEIMIFKGRRNSREYQGLTDDNGKFSVRLPAGDKYEIYILGFKDSTSYEMMEIPDPGPNASYKQPFVLSFQFSPAKTFILEGCNFETGQATLEPESYAVLDELVVFMNRKLDAIIEIGGHTDNVGKAAANIKLSMDRATAVMDYLLAKGISPERVTAKGYGMAQPIESNTSEEGRASNRRTEVKVLD